MSYPRGRRAAEIYWAVGTDPAVQHLLFNVDTPARAYEISHAEESEDFNYCLEDD
jgi:hypothetical protein